MSHAIVSKSRSTRITNIVALKAAVEKMGLEFRTCEPRKGHYRTWKDENGGWVGDWPLPKGVSAKEMGDNADYVISVPLMEDPGKRCYELGIVWDEADKCWYPAHDFYAGGCGLEDYIGETTVNGTTVIKSHQKLMDYYKVAELATKQRAKGKVVEFLKINQKPVLRIQ
jgi:hypothetical protein